MSALHRLTFKTARGKTWCLTPVDLGERQETLEHKIHQSIKSNGGILSRDWDWEFDCDTNQGAITVGPGRVIGTFVAEVTQEEASK